MSGTFKLVFECCSNEISLGETRATGKHGVYCHACETPWPETRVEREG